MSVVALIFVPSREARAQQLPQNRQPHAVLTDRGVAKTAAPPTKVGTTPSVDPKPASPTTKPVGKPVIPQPDPPTPSGKYETKVYPAPSSARPTPKQEAMSKPKPTPKINPVPQVDVKPVPGRPVARAPELAAFKGNKSLSSHTKGVLASGPTVPGSGKKRSHLLSSLGPPTSNTIETLRSATPREGLHPLARLGGATTSGAAKTLQSTTANPSKGLTAGSFSGSAAEGGNPSGTVLGSPFSGVEVALAPVVERTEVSEPPPAKTEGLPRSTPQPSPHPFALLLGSSLSPSSSQVAFGGNVTPLLLCVLVYGLILLWWYGRSSRAFCELPKLNSVVLPALERPG